MYERIRRRSEDHTALADDDGRRILGLIAHIFMSHESENKVKIAYRFEHLENMTLVACAIERTGVVTWLLPL
jgi:hypothetical protein